MNNYSIYLSANGDSFDCHVHNHGLSGVLVNKLEDQLDDNEILYPNRLEVVIQGENFFLVFSVYEALTEYEYTLSTRKIQHAVNPSEVPAFIKEALSCKTRVHIPFHTAM